MWQEKKLVRTSAAAGAPDHYAARIRGGSATRSNARDLSRPYRDESARSVLAAA
jgi:hypothetical protein